MIGIILSALLLGAWRAWDGSGAYIKESRYRVAICAALCGAIAISQMSLAGSGMLPTAACLVLLAAGVTWSLQRGFTDWSDPLGVMAHFLLPTAAAIAPWVAWMAYRGPTATAFLAIPFVGVCMLSGLAYAYEDKLFGRIKVVMLGSIKFDAHRYAEFVNGACHGAMLAIVARMS